MLTFLMLLEQSKAFDFVNYELLVAKLTYIGGNAACRWMSSYRNDRSRRVVLPISKLFWLRRSWKKHFRPIVFFSIYFVDIHVMYVFILAFICMQMTLKYITLSCYRPDEYLASGVDFCEKHGLRLNYSKNKAMCISLSGRHCDRGNQSFSLYVKNERILVLLSIIDCLLRITISIFAGLLCWSWNFFIIKKNLSTDVKLKLVQSVIYPHIFYGGYVNWFFLRNRISQGCNAHKMSVYDLFAICFTDTM